MVVVVVCGREGGGHSATHMQLPFPPAFGARMHVNVQATMFYDTVFTVRIAGLNELDSIVSLTMYSLFIDTATVMHEVPWT